MLSGQELRQQIEAGSIVIDPPVEDLDNLGVSLDLTLHNVFWRSTLPSGLKDVEVVVELNADPYEFMVQEQHDELILEPGDFILAETAEGLGVPLDLCAWIEGKSGRARLGLEVHLTAPKIDPGWGLASPKRITLEIVNHNHVSVRMRAGAPIAQVVFDRLGTPADEPYQGVHAEKGSQAP